MKIKHVYGNVLRIDIPLTIKTRTIEGGAPSEREDPFYPDATKGCVVELANNYNRKVGYEATIQGNVAHIEDMGKISIGQYKVTVKCYDTDGNPYRYMVRDIVEICDATADAGIEAGVEFNAETYTLEGAVFVSYGVEQVQSDWAETNHEEKSFIKNKPNHIVTDEHYVHTDNNYTDEEKEKLADLENYDDSGIRQELDGKVDKVAGKGLSTNDFTNEDKSKLNSALQSETDPTVPSWAKQPNKPSYTSQEVGALPNSTKYGSTIDLAMDSATYVLTLSLKDQDGTVLNTKTVDLPIESVVVNGRYDAANKKIVLTLQSGSTIDVPVGDLIAGLQTEITSVNMLDADLVDDANSTHKFVTAQEKANWNSKSDFSGSYNDLSDKPTIPTTLSQLSEDATHRTVSDAEKTTWGNKQETLVSGTNIKTVNNTSLLGSGNIDTSEVFWATYGTTTAAEIDAAVAAGKIVKVSYLNGEYSLADVSTQYYFFFRVTQTGLLANIRVTRADSTWIYLSSGLESINHRKSSWSATPNNTNYPSEKLVKDSIDAVDKVFVAEYGVTTYQQVADAVNAGKIVFAMKDDLLYVFRNINTTSGLISFFNVTDQVLNTIRINDSNVWRYYYYSSETVGNRVTSWQSTPDNTHYPSEKLVKDSLDAIDKLVEIEYGTTTAAQIDALLTDEKIPYLVEDFPYYEKGVVCFFVEKAFYGEAHTSNSYIFAGGKGDSCYVAALNLTTGSWSKNTTSLQSKAYYAQNSMSGDTTNIYKYPSTKAVADYAEKKTDIVAPVNTTDATLPITTLSCEVGKYYRIDVPIDTLAVTLPAMTDLTTVKTIVIYLTADTTPAVTITSADNKDVYYQDGFEIEAGSTYEINALFNGAAWIVAAVKINTSNS